MLNKILAFLYRVVHTSGRLLGLAADLGPFHLSLYVGREEPDMVRFSIDAELSYGAFGPPMLSATVEVGVIKVELTLTKSYSE